jgi:hypothetical protein
MWIAGAVVLAMFQPVTTTSDGLGFDGASYHAMAEQLTRDDPPRAVAPFVYRVGTPWLASTVTRITGWSLAESFRRVNLLSSLAATLLLMRWLRRHVSTGRGRWLVLGVFLCEPHSPLRFTYYYPVNTDPIATCLLLSGLNLIDWIRDHPTRLRIATLAALVVVGVAVREVVLIVAVALLFISLERAGAAPRLRLWLPLACGLLAMTAVRAWVVVQPSSYSFVDGVLYWIRWKTPAQLTLAPLLVFGPLAALPVVLWADTRRLLASRFDWCVYLGCFAVLAWIGGSDTERTLIFGSPIVWLLIASALNRVSAGSWLAVAGVVQLLSLRVFVPIAGPPPSLLPRSLAWLSDYDSFWSFSLTREQIVF